ncbi:MAG: hypothetical protein FWG68_03445 [Defluviitaleaceae bacterium]|nr:hypothetical protein [Defluviitaleaceae bacterium]
MLHRVNQTKNGIVIRNSNIFIAILLGFLIGIFAIVPFAASPLFEESDLFVSVAVLLSLIIAILATILIARRGMGNKILLTPQALEITLHTGKYTISTFEFAYENIVGVEVKKRALAIVLHDKIEEIETRLKLKPHQIQALSTKVKLLGQATLSTQAAQEKFTFAESTASFFVWRIIFSVVSAVVFGVVSFNQGFVFWPPIAAFILAFLLTFLMGRSQNYLAENEVHYSAVNAKITRQKNEVTKIVIKKRLTGFHVALFFGNEQRHFGTVNEDCLQNFLTWNSRLKIPYTVVKEPQ